MEEMKKYFWKKMLVVAAVIAVLSLALVYHATAGDRVVYTVKNGDTLGELMYTWRVQGVEIEKLYSWNSNLGTQVKVGQEIIYYLPDRPETKKLSEQEVKKVVAEVMAQTKGAQESKKDRALYLLSLSVGIAVVTILSSLIISLLWRNRRKDRAGKKVATHSRQRKVLETDDPNLKEVECFGYITKVRRVQRDDEWVWELPFRNILTDESLGEKIWNENFRKLLSSLARCLEPGSKFESQIPGLLGGDIRKI